MKLLLVILNVTHAQRNSVRAGKRLETHYYSYLNA